MAISLKDMILADDAAATRSYDWQPSDNDVTLAVDVTLLGLPLTLRGRISEGRARKYIEVWEASPPPLVRAMLRRVFYDRRAAELLVLRSGVGPLFWERLNPPEQEAVHAKLGVPDFEEILDPLASSLPADQRASWRALRGTDLWWDHVGEPIFLAVDVEAEGALIEFLDLRWSTAAVEES